MSSHSPKNYGCYLCTRSVCLQVDSIIMAGNQISRLPTDMLMYMSHIKKVDLRMNKLQLLPTETAKFRSLEHVTHIDIRDNQVSGSPDQSIGGKGMGGSAKQFVAQGQTHACTHTRTNEFTHSHIHRSTHSCMHIL